MNSKYTERERERDWERERERERERESAGITRGNIMIDGLKKLNEDKIDIWVLYLINSRLYVSEIKS